VIKTKNKVKISGDKLYKKMRLIIPIILIIIHFNSAAQEIKSGLQVNPVVRAKALEVKKQKDQGYVQDTTPVQMPFYDDFSALSVYPSADRWINHDAYVNSDYPVYPIDLGVATLDALNDSGFLYPVAVPGPQSFVADHLTSRPIRLDSIFSPTPRALRPSDSVYLSFYYQPQGRGLAPQQSDSLILQFLETPAHDSLITADSTIIVPAKWRRIWSSLGMSLDTFYLVHHVYFRRVMIPVTDSATFFKKRFTFQFLNYASLASAGQPSWQSNSDEWNIDDVYLNAGRTMNDTIHRQIRFLERAPSLLKHYTAMPYPQYCNNPTNEIADSLNILITNRDTVDRNSTYGYSVTQPAGSFNKTYSTAFNLTTFYKYEFPYTIRPPVSFIFPISAGDSASYFVEHTVKDNTMGSIMGDTITGYQNFYNYYAYDDGTPEAGYGLKGTGAELALRFSLNKSPDTLRGIRMYFNRTLNNANLQPFLLTVWNDNNGKPGDTIYSRQVIVQLPDTIDQFVTYRLETAVRVSGTFYIGTIQTTDDNLNIGIDTYNDAHQNLMYNVIGNWLTSSYQGALLMRPLVGKPLPVGIRTIPASAHHLSIFPNPTNTGSISLSIAGAEDQVRSLASADIKIYNLFGQPVYDCRYTKVITIPDLPAGIYPVVVTNPGTGNTWTGKLIITK
jgi:hypothetical protein